MKTIALILTVVLAGCNLAIAQSPYATRLPAELQTAQMDSLAVVPVAAGMHILTAKAIGGTGGRILEVLVVGNSPG